MSHVYNILNIIVCVCLQRNLILGLLVLKYNQNAEKRCCHDAPSIFIYLPHGDHSGASVKGADDGGQGLLSSQSPGKSRCDNGLS